MTTAGLVLGLNFQAGYGMETQGQKSQEAIPLTIGDAVAREALEKNSTTPCYNYQQNIKDLLQTKNGAEIMERIERSPQLKDPRSHDLFFGMIKTLLEKIEENDRLDYIDDILTLFTGVSSLPEGARVFKSYHDIPSNQFTEKLRYSIQNLGHINNGWAKSSIISVFNHLDFLINNQLEQDIIHLFQNKNQKQSISILNCLLNFDPQKLKQSIDIWYPFVKDADSHLCATTIRFFSEIPLEDCQAFATFAKETCLYLTSESVEILGALFKNKYRFNHFCDKVNPVIIKYGSLTPRQLTQLTLLNTQKLTMAIDFTSEIYDSKIYTIDPESLSEFKSYLELSAREFNQEKKRHYGTFLYETCRSIELMTDEESASFFQLMKPFLDNIYFSHFTHVMEHINRIQSKFRLETMKRASQYFDYLFNPERLDTINQLTQFIRTLSLMSEEDYEDISKMSTPFISGENKIKNLGKFAILLRFLTLLPHQDREETTPSILEFFHGQSLQENNMLLIIFSNLLPEFRKSALIKSLEFKNEIGQSNFEMLLKRPDTPFRNVRGTFVLGISKLRTLDDVIELMKESKKYL